MFSFLEFMKSAVLQVSGLLVPVLALVIAIGIAGVAIIIIYSKKEE